MADAQVPTSAVKVSIVVISKDEPALSDTLDLLGDQIGKIDGLRPDEAEILVVDASSGRLDAIRAAHPTVRWIDFERPEGVRISIPTSGIGACTMRRAKSSCSPTVVVFQNPDG